MASRWQAFVDQAIGGEPDDPFVRLLRQRIESGSRVVRVELDMTKKTPEYRVLLERLRELSEMRVPHSWSFTRWSLGTGVRMASEEEEEKRFALLVAEHFLRLVDDFGADYTNAIFVERLRTLAPPRAKTLLVNVHVYATAPGSEQIRAIRALDATLASMARDLGGMLRYSEPASASILDGALERFVSDHFHTPARALQSAG